MRILIHSVLSGQVGPNWWDTAVDPGLKREVARRQSAYSRRRSHTVPGRHAVYYLYLSELNRILSAHSHLFDPVLETTALWVARLEVLRTSRNVVSHMNFPNAYDRTQIEQCYADFAALLARLKGSALAMQIP